jgi:Ca2+-binding EF-hand superfamily protein
MIQSQEMNELQGWFRSIDKDNSGHITANELMGIQFGGQRFGLETARKLVKVFDRDNSGNIGFQEFAALYKFIVSMQTAFFQFDRDRSGRLDYNEIVQALQQGGFMFSPPVLQNLIKRFQRPNMAGLTFENFIQLCAFLGQIRSTFDALDPQRRGQATISLEQLVNIASAF